MAVANGPPEAPLDSELALLVQAVLAGGNVARDRFGSNVEAWTKTDGSPVSDADIATDKAIAQILREGRPDYGWCSEETGRVSGSAPRTFIVDPIDGTRGFLRGDAEWTVVAAIEEGGRPVAAAIFQPLTDVVFAAALGQGATRNGSTLAVSPCHGIDGALVAARGPVFNASGLRAAGARKADYVCSLALRIALVADGTFDAAVTKAGPHHWDLAAADLIVHEAGGTLTTLTGALPRYDTAVTAHAPVVAATPCLAEAVRRFAADHHEATDGVV